MTEAAGKVDKRAYYALGMLVVVYTLNFIDRQIISILMPSIQMELEISDFLGGMLGGTFFAIFYSTLGIPIATIADRGNRRNLISIALLVWSGMTALCGMAQNFVQLAIARLGVGVGEAGCSPPAHSMISDYFPPKQRATALGVYSLGISLGIMFGLFIGGKLDALYGWRTAFIIVGLPGVLLALVFWLTVWEPPRGHSESRQRADHQPSVLETFVFMLRRRSFVHLSVGAGLAAFGGYGVVFWFPTFLARSHAMPGSEIGLWLGLILGIAGGLGIFMGGFTSDRFGAKDSRWKLWTFVVATVISLPFSIAVYLVDSGYLALLIFIVPAFLSNFYQATSFAQTQSLANLRMRGVAAALLLLILNLIGLGLGPSLVGALSDLLAERFEGESMRYALLALNAISLWSAFHFYRAGVHLPGDLERADDPT